MTTISVEKINLLKEFYRFTPNEFMMIRKSTQRKHNYFDSLPSLVNEIYEDKLVLIIIKQHAKALA